MRLSIKIIVGIWVVLLLILGAVVYTAYSRLEPAALISLMREQVEKNYPGTELKVGAMDYRMGLDFKLSLSEISMIRSQKQLGRIGEIEIKIPWWLFLTDKGSAQINLSQLEIFIDRPTLAGNADSDSSNDEKVKKAAVKFKVNIPSYLTKAKYTIRAKDILIKDIKDSHRLFYLSKLLIREFQYGKNSAFELNLPIEVNHNDAKYDSQLWLFGDLTPRKDFWSINYRGEFKTKDITEKSQLEDIIIDGKAEFHSEDLTLDSSMNFLLEKENIGTGKFQADSSSLSINLDFRKFPLAYMSIINDEIKNPFLPALEGYAEGKLRLIKDNKSGLTSLTSRLSFDGTLPLDQELVYAGKWQLQFNDSKWESSFMTPNGEVSFFRRSIIDFGTGTLVQYNEEIGFSGIDFNKAVKPLRKISDMQLDKDQNYFVSTSSFKDCLQGESKINGEIKYGRSPDMTFYHLDLKESSSSLKVHYQLKNQVEQFNLEAGQFSWHDYPFLAPYFTAKTGVFDGKVQGKWKESWLAGEWLSNMKISGMTEASGKAPELGHKLVSTFDLQAVAAPISCSIEVRKNKVDIKSFILEGADPAKISGSLISTGPGSYLSLEYPKNKRWKTVRKELEAQAL